MLQKRFLHTLNGLQERKAAIQALAKHANHSPDFEEEYERLGGADLLNDLENVASPQERALIAGTRRQILEAQPDVPSEDGASDSRSSESHDLPTSSIQAQPSA